MQTVDDETGAELGTGENDPCGPTLECPCAEESALTDVDAKGSEIATTTPDQEQIVAQLLRATSRRPFGPLFFADQLAAFVRDRCPEPSERLPTVDLWLAQGEPIRVCHVIAVTPRWVVIAARDRDETDAKMTTEFHPYELIVRVSIGPTVARGRGIGFEQASRPALVDVAPPSPEEALCAASTPHA